MSETKDVRLLPCPFCGGNGRVVQSQFTPSLWHVQCDNCDCRRSAQFGEDRAVDVWNRRAALEPAPKPAVGEWVTVPRQPTADMLAMGDEAMVDTVDTDNWLRHCRNAWEAMLSAAPPAPAGSSSGDRCDDCGRTYDTIYRVPNDVWALIAPHPETLGDYPEHYYGGMLCPDCAVDRAKANGIKLVFVAERADAPAASPSGGEVNVTTRVWRLPDVETVLSEMCAVATGGDEEHDDICDHWPIDNRADVDRWQAAIRSALTSPEAPQASEVVRELVLNEIKRLRPRYQTFTATDAGRRQMLDHFENMLAAYKRSTTDGQS